MTDDTRVKGYNYFSEPGNDLEIPRTLVVEMPKTIGTITHKLSDSIFQVDGVSPSAIFITGYSYVLKTDSESQVYIVFAQDGSPDYTGDAHQFVIQSDGINQYESYPIYTNADLHASFDTVDFVGVDGNGTLHAVKSFEKERNNYPKMTLPDDSIILTKPDSGLGDVLNFYRINYVGFYPKKEVL